MDNGRLMKDKQKLIPTVGHGACLILPGGRNILGGSLFTQFLNAGYEVC